MKKKTIKFKSIEFDEIEGDTGTVHHEYKMDEDNGHCLLSWFKDGQFQDSYYGEEMDKKIYELMN